MKINTIVKKELILFFTIGTIMFYLDYIGIKKVYNNCKDGYKTLFIHWLHHMCSSFLTFGWISSNKTILKLHITTVSAVLLVQILNDGKCPITDMINMNCNIKAETFLRDFLYFSGIKSSKHIYNYHIYRISSIFISLYKLKNK